MKRFSILVAALAAVLLFARPALAVNLHNGAIVVHNNMSSEIHVKFEYKGMMGHFIQEFDIAPGKTAITDSCCFAAGSPYRIHVFRSRPHPMDLTPFVFTPHLCNKNGIPYGYAVIDVNENYSIHEIDQHSCY